jgi:Serine/threonine protein kinase
LAEARRLKALEGDRILRVHDVDIVEDGDCAYLATELALGSAEARLEDLGGVGVRPDLVVTWVRQALIGLSACHGQGFIHRDVKPGNVFLTGNEWAQLGDFGADQPILWPRRLKT